MRRLILVVAVGGIVVGAALSTYAVVSRPAAAPTQKVTPTPSPSPSPTPSPSTTPTAASTATPPPSPASLPVWINTSDYGYVAAGTSAGASCALSGTYPDGSPVAGVRNPQVANSDGRVQWSYPQLANPPSPAGSPGIHKVTCTLNGLTNSDSKYFYARPGL